MTTQDKASPQGVTLLIGGKYNWKGQPERMVYLGHNWSGNGHWHQFALEAEPGVVWCEVLPSELFMIEKTALSQPPAPEQVSGEPTREGACVALLEAAHAFWKSEKRHGAYGAVKFAEFESGELVIFTRGEYREKLMAAVGGIEDGPHYFRAATPTAEPAAPVAAKPEQQAQAGEPLYYLQDTRSYVGNCPLWWAQDGNGYTSDLRKAHRYTFQEAMGKHLSRETDLPWACSEIDPLQRPTIDVQDMHKLRSNAAQIAAIQQAEEALK